MFLNTFKKVFVSIDALNFLEHSCFAIITFLIPECTILKCRDINYFASLPDIFWDYGTEKVTFILWGNQDQKTVLDAWNIFYIPTHVL